ncbi:MAG: type II toxin-antitoxin system VapC family toxin [Gemmatimonadota bacterium]|uniref:type II toxin-antitoxin system VapC family toxin n=1 Tax=Candidatus Palauibacter scopulicola TaxID=3056741 RepID=UPI0013F83A60|nr:type II toxin-antitoxin system VapC family toxin [Candidatus Palauibacter scopulicola]MDE2662135.1 type II toxin-antitoxin system VapC family toxin [Candidatus Palauibacter scopulicola]MYC89628.1 type II toxin-antitoxin system VapC family toxin [Candidatus Palauibacter denitrificans]
MRRPFRWLIDTNVVSEMMRPAPDPRVAGFLDGIWAQGVGLASVTVWEILNGIGRLDASRRREHLAERFQGLLDDLFRERVLDWSLSDARACARIMESKRRRGEPLDDHLPDAMLAGVAARHGLTLVTRNERDFRNTGIEVFNPWVDGSR